ncbi:hypothetical protein [Stutzerimonas stutzeri]|nr:hypothetical protein [Stutzerimonas stutzeri]
MADEPEETQSDINPVDSTQDVDDGGLTDEDVDMFEDDPSIPTE